MIFAVCWMAIIQLDRAASIGGGQLSTSHPNLVDRRAAILDPPHLTVLDRTNLQKEPGAEEAGLNLC